MLGLFRPYRLVVETSQMSRLQPWILKCNPVLCCFAMSFFIEGGFYGGPRLSHQNQMLTANSNRSQQIQIAHSKLQIAHSKFKSLTANYKSLTANSNRSQQIQIAHGKFKSLPFCRGSRVFFRVSLFYTEKCMELSKEN